MSGSQKLSKTEFLHLWTTPNGIDLFVKDIKVACVRIDINFPRMLICTVERKD